MEKDFKIICFVHNKLNDIGGLYHAFGEKKDTEDSFISRFLYTVDNRGTVMPKFGQGENITNKFLLITEKGIPDLKPEIAIEDNWDILLVSQDFDINQFPENLFTAEMLVMYHKNQFNSKEIEGWVGE